MRIFHKLYAKMFGYFWIPCPLCGDMFGGHERHAKKSLRVSNNSGKVVCQYCEIVVVLENYRRAFQFDFEVVED